MDALIERVLPMTLKCWQRTGRQTHSAAAAAAAAAVANDKNQSSLSSRDCASSATWDVVEAGCRTSAASTSPSGNLPPCEKNAIADIFHPELNRNLN